MNNIKQSELLEFGSTVAKFLTHHKRLCDANKGGDCMCGLITAREQLERLTGRGWWEQEQRAAEIDMEPVK